MIRGVAHTWCKVGCVAQVAHVQCMCQRMKDGQAHRLDPGCLVLAQAMAMAAATSPAPATAPPITAYRRQPSCTALVMSPYGRASSDHYLFLLPIRPKLELVKGEGLGSCALVFQSNGKAGVQTWLGLTPPKAAGCMARSLCTARGGRVISPRHVRAYAIPLLTPATQSITAHQACMCTPVLS